MKADAANQKHHSRMLKCSDLSEGLNNLEILGGNLKLSFWNLSFFFFFSLKFLFLNLETNFVMTLYRKCHSSREQRVFSSQYRDIIM